MTSAYDRVLALPPPQVVEQIAQERILSRMVTDLRALAADWRGEETDPMYLLLEAGSGYAYLLRQYFNVRARSQFLAFATGGDLRHIVAREGVFPEDGESDESLRRRGLLVPLARSGAGTAVGLRANAMLASPNVFAVRHVVQADLSVNVYISATAEGEIQGARPGTPSPELTTVVSAYLNDDRRKEPEDTIIVSSPSVTGYTITANVRFSSATDDESVVEARVRAALHEYIRSRLVPGASVRVSKIEAVLHQEGVAWASLSAPAADLVPAGDDAMFSCFLTEAAVDLTMTDIA